MIGGTPISGNLRLPNQANPDLQRRPPAQKQYKKTAKFHSDSAKRIPLLSADVVPDGHHSSSCQLNVFKPTRPKN